MKKYPKFIFIFCVGFFYLSCSKDDASNPENPENPVDIYTVGRENNTSETSYAKIWKNGIASELTAGISISNANDVCVYGNDVYVAGNEYSNEDQHYVPKIWKNGVATNYSNALGNTDGTLYSVTANNSGVFACGYERNTAGIWVATYWDNGLPVPLTNGIENAYAKDIAINNSNIYVVGRASIDGHTKACLWKDGVLTELANGDYYSTSESVCVVGNDVYIAGFKESDANDMAMLWKNGVEIPLSDTANDSYAMSIKVVDNKVYSGGWEQISGIDVATVWIDGVANPITDGTKNANILDIEIIGNNVYASGYEEDASGNVGIAKLWKNGEEMYSLTNIPNNGYAAGISVVNR